MLATDLRLVNKFNPDRQKLSVKGSKSNLASDTKLAEVGVTDGGELIVKDLGPQISWRTVFLIEYVRRVLLMLWAQC